MEFFKNRVISKVDWIIIGASMFLLVVVTLVYLVALSFLGERAGQLEAETVKARAELAEARAIAARKDGLEKELEEVRKNISSFEEKLPTDKEVPKLLYQFQQIAELSGLKYQSITAEPIDEKESFVRIPFKVKVKAKYPDLGKFLRSLEFGSRFIKVEDLQIGPEKEGISEADFVISTFMFVTKVKQSESGVTQS